MNRFCVGPLLNELKSAIRDNGPLQGRILSRRQGRAGEVPNAPRQKRYKLPCLERPERSRSIPMAYRAADPAPSSIDLSGLRQTGVEAIRPRCSHCVARTFVPSRAPRLPEESSCGRVRPERVRSPMKRRASRTGTMALSRIELGRAELVPGRMMPKTIMTSSRSA